MGDRLVEILKYFELQARVFQSGPMCHTASFDGAEGLGYIHILQQGTLEVESPAHTALFIEEPSLFLYFNPTEHRLTPQSDNTAMVCASFKFGTGLTNPLMRELPDIVCLKLQEIASLDNVLTAIFKEANEDHCGRQAILDRLMEVIFIQVLRYLMDEGRVELGLLAGLADERLCKAINAMHQAPAKNWSLEELAMTAGMSRARFAATFRDIVGLTPGVYLSEWRVSVAQAMLRDGKPVQLVADCVGYGSASALSRVFKAQLGMSPTCWLRGALESET